ncbi:hypothetical protein E2562_006807 [Oryza meyeriana var. granulata]|uniref:Uncharacterized protein n=1 Tax=Oryza meyeriana var. granulata TaxID=110450 RepID=A0A6G1C4J3_9ORYZ|nr:hypothetical protein E2562_006807 [Oryza meyeriana var. granulata]
MATRSGCQGSGGGGGVGEPTKGCHGCGVHRSNLGSTCGVGADLDDHCSPGPSLLVLEPGYPSVPGCLAPGTRVRARVLHPGTDLAPGTLVREPDHAWIGSRARDLASGISP